MSDLTSKNKALMRRIYEEMWNRADPSIAAEIFAQPEGVKLFVSQFLLSFANLQHTINEMIAEDDRVAVRFSTHGTHTGQWLHFAPTGKAIHYTGITLAHISGDKIIDHHTWWDKMELVEQIETAAGPG
jgi:predicted ester cyclase